MRIRPLLCARGTDKVDLVLSGRDSFAPSETWLWLAGFVTLHGQCYGDQSVGVQIGSRSPQSKLY
eukprot:SAG31_NODE_39881_length_284_cov_6.621622_1_plen_64_part_10